MESDDPVPVGCERWQEALSATADGEPTEIDPRLVDAHVARCPSCRAFRAMLMEHPSAARATLREAEPLPDLAPAIVRRAAAADRARAWPVARVALAVVAVEVIVVASPDLLLGRDSDGPAHAVRHLGAFSIAYAVALLMVVWRPARARTILPVAAVLAGALLITAIIDVIEGRVPLTGEATHLPELLSVPLVWLLAVPTAGSTGPLGRLRRRPTRSGPAELQLVGPTESDPERPAI